MLVESVLFGYNSDIHENVVQDVNEERTNKLEKAVSSYKTAPKTIFSGGSFSVFNDCISDESVYLMHEDSTCSNKEVSFNSSCILEGIKLYDEESLKLMKYFDMEFRIHVAHACFRVGSLFCSRDQLSEEGEWSKNGEVEKVSGITMNSLVECILKKKPNKVVFNTIKTSDGLSSNGYYMLDELNNIISKVIIIVDHDSVFENYDNKAWDLVRDSGMMDIMLFMGELSEDYFEFKYSHLIDFYGCSRDN